MQSHLSTSLYQRRAYIQNNPCWSRNGYRYIEYRYIEYRYIEYRYSEGLLYYYYYYYCCCYIHLWEKSRFTLLFIFRVINPLKGCYIDLLPYWFLSWLETLSAHHNTLIKWSLSIPMHRSKWIKSNYSLASSLIISAAFSATAYTRLWTAGNLR